MSILSKGFTGLELGVSVWLRMSGDGPVTLKGTSPVGLFGALRLAAVVSSISLNLRGGAEPSVR